jgi:hypothetical protein
MNNAMTQSGLSQVQMLRVAITGSPAVIDGCSVSGDLYSYTMRDKRTGRAVFTESGWLDRDALPDAIRAALNKYESAASMRLEALRSARQDGARAGLKADFTADATTAKAALLAAITDAL